MNTKWLIRFFVSFRIFAPWPLLGCQGRMEGSIVGREIHSSATLLHCYIATKHCPPFWAAIAQVAGSGGGTMEMISGNRHEPIWSPVDRRSMHWGFSYLGPEYGVASRTDQDRRGETTTKDEHKPEETSSNRHELIWSCLTVAAFSYFGPNHKRPGGTRGTTQ